MEIVLCCCFILALLFSPSWINPNRFVFVFEFHSKIISSLQVRKNNLNWLIDFVLQEDGWPAKDSSILLENCCCVVEKWMTTVTRRLRLWQWWYGHLWPVKKNSTVYLDWPIKVDICGEKKSNKKIVNNNLKTSSKDAEAILEELRSKNLSYLLQQW